MIKQAVASLLLAVLILAGPARGTVYTGSWFSGTPGNGYWQKHTPTNAIANRYNMCFKGDTASVSSAGFDECLNLIWYCSGESTLAGDYAGAQPAALNISWYKMLTGKIDRYPITMHLHKAGHLYSGYYYYDLQQQPLYFTGEDSSLKGRIRIAAFSDGENTEEFVFSFSGDEAAGNWKKAEKSKAVTFAATETKSPTAFQYVFASGRVPLRPGLNIEGASAASYYAASVWPAGDTPEDLYIKTTIRKLFNSNNATEEIGALFLREKKKFFAEYFKENSDVKESEIRQLPTAYTQEEDSKLMVAYLSPKILTLALNNYSYSGGVHGNYGTTYTCIDLTNNRQIVLTDVLNEQGKKVIGGLLEKYFRKACHLAPGEPLQNGGIFENTIKPNRNFYLTSKGLMFNYSPYEIGPYAMGEVNIFIPVAEVEKYLQPGIRNLLL